MKQCTGKNGCGKWKSLDEFYDKRSSKSGKMSLCKECALKCSKQWQQDNAERVRHYKILYYYNLTPEELCQMLIEQDYCCSICREPPPEGQELQVDHDHTTGKVRGLLCPQHNKALGNFGDNPEWLRRAADYLELTGNTGEL